uniref:Uncharacterized protein n=1 Tax=Aegilops tauschii subsp. strangulata TaxID=200361 RepID=A0A453AEJ1_AEGTS
MPKYNQGGEIWKVHVLDHVRICDLQHLEHDLSLLLFSFLLAIVLTDLVNNDIPEVTFMQNYVSKQWSCYQVFGNDKKYWFIPAYSEEDLRRMPALQGLDYPVRTDLDGQEL